MTPLALVGGTPRPGVTPPSGGPRGGATATAATPGLHTSTLALRQGQGERGTSVVGASPNPLTHSTVSTTPGRVTVDPPRGGDSSETTRSAAPRVAPAPLRYAIKAALVAIAYLGIHTAAAHPLTAVLLAVTFLTITALAARRSHHA